jgi:hypothetical protein
MSRRLTRDARGISAVEFGLVAPPLLLILMALFDLGMRAYIGVQLQGTLDQASRKVTVGTSASATISSFVQQRIGMVLKNATVAVTTKDYDSFSHVGKPEPITTDTAPLGTYNKGDCFLDINGNGTWDSDSSTTGTGSGDDVVYYTAVVSYPALMPLGRWLGWSSTETVSATTMMRNQPYAAQIAPATVCT